MRSERTSCQRCADGNKPIKRCLVLGREMPVKVGSKMTAIGSVRLNRMVNRMVKCWEAALCGAIQGPRYCGTAWRCPEKLSTGHPGEGLSPVETTGEWSQRGAMGSQVSFSGCVDENR